MSRATSAECRVPSYLCPTTRLPDSSRHSALGTRHSNRYVSSCYTTDQRTGRQRKGVGSPEGNASHGREIVDGATGSAGEHVTSVRGTAARRGRKETGAAMQIGVPKEIKDNENRVALTPAGVVELIHHGHQLLVERGAGSGSGFTDDEY